MSTPKNPKQTISFRLPPTFLRQLAALANERKARSPDDLARQFVIDAMTNADLRPQLESLQEQVAMLRDDMVIAVAYAMQVSGKVDAKNARRTAEQIFRKGPTRE